MDWRPPQLRAERENDREVHWGGGGGGGGGGEGRERKGEREREIVRERYRGKHYS